jgi:hypothetical protein
MKEEGNCFENFPPKKQSDVNHIVVSTAEKVYKSINQHWTYAKAGEGEKLSTTSAFWTKKNIKGKLNNNRLLEECKNIPTLILNTTPDKIIEALEDLISKPASLECTIALTTTKIFCLKELLGREAFCRYASAFYKAIETSDTWKVEEFFHELPLQFIARGQGKAIPGSIVYITNIPLYSHFKPFGNGTGSNVFCTAEDGYIGFSAIYKNGHQCLEKIESQDFNLFVQPNDVEKNHDQHAKICNTLNFDSFVKIRRKAQEKEAINIYQIFDFKEITNFLETGKIYL